MQTALILVICGQQIIDMIKSKKVHNLDSVSYSEHFCISLFMYNCYTCMEDILLLLFLIW